MPTKPKQICREPTCHRKTKGAYCKEHKKQSYGFSSDLHPFYNHKIWRGSNPNKPLGQRGGLREMQLREVPYCEKCKEEKGIIKDVSFGGIVDHIVAWKTGETEQERWSLFTDFDNLQTLCVQCHNSKSAKESNR